MCIYKGIETNKRGSIFRCVYKGGNTPMISVHGKVTDFQLWDKVLSDEELIQVRAILPPLY